MSATRREFLQATGVGAAGVVATGGFLAAGPLAGAQGPPADQVGLVATDGHITLPNRPGVPPRPLYIFGFTPVPFGDSVSSLINNYKGEAQTPAPILDFEAEVDVNIKLTNLGLVARPDLADSHTIHWHGFRTPAALMDGVPEVSIAVPPSASSPTSIAPTTRAPTCITATSRTSSTCRWG